MPLRVRDVLVAAGLDSEHFVAVDALPHEYTWFDVLSHCHASTPDTRPGELRAEV
jgi:hypothetical protein